MTNEESIEVLKNDIEICTIQQKQACDMAIKALESQRWIPVSERLPDKLNDVLISFYDCPNEYDVAYLRTTINESYKKSGAKNEWVSSMGETTYADYEVDAWMPIQPYKAESEEYEDKRACEKCIHYVTRDSRGVVLCGCDSWECDFEEVKT